MCCCGCAGALGILETLAWRGAMVDDGVLVAGCAVGTAVVQVVGECCLGNERELLAVLKARSVLYVIRCRNTYGTDLLVT